MKSFGERCADLVLPSFAPVGADGLVLREGEVDWSGVWSEWLSGLTLRARLGAWLGLFFAFTAPLWAYGRPRSIARLSWEARARAMGALLVHRFYLVRELALMIKVCACLAMFRSSSVRARSGYDRPASAGLRLPVLGAEAA